MVNVGSQYPLKLGFIGGALNSAVGYTHFNASRLDGYFRVDAGCFSRHDQQNEHSAKVYGISPERSYLDWQTLLKQEKGQVDALVILTPTPSHMEIAIAAIEAGYPVICEKALATSTDECLQIENAVKANNGYLAVTYNYSGYPMVRELRRMISEGHFGSLQQIQIEMPQESFLRVNANPQDWRRKDYAVPTVSLDLGVHVHHLVDFLSGGLKPISLVGEQASYGQLPGIIDNVYCIARYHNDLRVQAWWGKTALGHRNGLRVRVYGREPVQSGIKWTQRFFVGLITMATTTYLIVDPAKQRLLKSLDTTDLSQVIHLDSLKPLPISMRISLKKFVVSLKLKRLRVHMCMEPLMRQRGCE